MAEPKDAAPGALPTQPSAAGELQAARNKGGRPRKPRTISEYAHQLFDAGLRKGNSPPTK